MSERKAPDLSPQRVHYYDLLRLISFALIVWYHMLIQLQIGGICGPEKVTPLFMSPNMHVATLAVALFFMLSGAGLSVSAEKKFSLGSYYRKRFLRLLVPFYVAVLLYYVFTLVVHGTMPSPFRQGTPAWRYIFTLLGMDEWLSMHGYPTFSCSIGEWFLGALIILTVLFPLFRYLMNRWPKAFFTACTCVYVYVSYNYTSGVAMHMSLPLKGYEFILGMYLAKYFRRFPDPLKIAAVPLTVFFFFSTSVLNLNNALKITLSAVALFISVSALEPYLGKSRFRILEKISPCLYHWYLIHHVVIYFMTPRFAPYYGGKISVAVFFAIECLIMAVVTVPVKFLSDFAAKGLSAVLPGGKK